MYEPDEHADVPPAARHVLVVALAFPPGATAAAIPAAQMAVYLPRLGWFPTFLTVRAERLRVRHEARDAHPLPWERIGVHRTRIVFPWEGLVRLAWWRRKGASSGPGWALQPTPSSPTRVRPTRRLISFAESLLNFPDSSCGWLPFAVWGGLAVARRRPVDCVYSIGPPWTSHVVGLILHHLLGRPWIADFHDPWTRNPWHCGRPWPLAGLEARLEQRVLRDADTVVAKTPEITRLLAESVGRSPGRGFATIPCAYDPEEVIAARRLAHKRSDRFVLTHAGRFYGPRSPVPLLRAVAQVAQDTHSERRLELRLVSEVDSGIQKLAQQLGIAPLIRQVGLASHLQTLRHVLESDLAVLVQPGTGVQIPSKAYEYLGCGVSILALTGEGATARLIRDTRAGLVVAPEDVSGIASALRAFQHSDQASAHLEPDQRAIEQLAAPVVMGRVAGLLGGLGTRD